MGDYTSSAPNGTQRSAPLPKATAVGQSANTAGEIGDAVLLRQVEAQPSVAKLVALVDALRSGTLNAMRTEASRLHWFMASDLGKLALID